MTRVPLHRIDIASATTPVQVIEGQLWFDTATNKLKVYNGASFDEYSLQADLSDHISSTTAHDATDLVVDPSAIGFSSSNNVQGLLNDLDSNFYDSFLNEHKSNGEHGPNVTVANTTATDAVEITQSGAGNPLVINQDYTGPQTALVVNNSGSANAIGINNFNDGRALSIADSSSSNFGIIITKGGDATALYIDKTSTGAGVVAQVDNAGEGIGLLVNQSKSGGAGNAINVIQDGDAKGIYIEHSGSSGIGLDVDNNSDSVAASFTRFSSTSAAVLYVNQNSASCTGQGVLIQNAGVGEGLHIQNQSTASTDPGILVQNSGAGEGIQIQNSNALNGDAVIRVDNSGSGYDVQGNLSNWHIDKFGGANIKGLFTGGWRNKTVSASTITVNDYDMAIRLLPSAGTTATLTTINGGNDGQIIILASDTGDTISINTSGNISVNANHALDDPRDKSTFIYDATAGKWCNIALFSNNT